MQQETAINLCLKEINWADTRWGPFKSTHEGYGVLVEEMAELLEAIHKNNEPTIKMESIQVAAVALRISISLSNDETRYRSRLPD